MTANRCIYLECYDRRGSAKSSCATVQLLIVPFHFITQKDSMEQYKRQPVKTMSDSDIEGFLKTVEMEITRRGFAGRIKAVRPDE